MSPSETQTLGFCRRKQIDVPFCRSGVWGGGPAGRAAIFSANSLAACWRLEKSRRGSLFAWRWSDSDLDAGAIGLSINCFAYQVQRSFKPFRPLIPIVPRPVRKSQASVRQLLHDASDLDPVAYFILLQEMILDHFTQILCAALLAHGLCVTGLCRQTDRSARSVSPPYTAAGPPPMYTARAIVSATSSRVAPC